MKKAGEQMQHSFDIEIASKYGVHAAILLNSLYFWIEKNRANNNNFYEGHYWTYNSKKAFAALFPYMNSRQIDYALKKLIDDGIVITGNYNKSSYDRTLWYAITKKGYCILQNCKMETTNLGNGFDEIVKPIPDINTDINTDNKINNFVDVNRTPLYPPKGSGAGDESVENEGKEAYSGGESADEYGNIDDYPVSVEEPPEIDYDHMTPYQQFVFDWNIRNDVDNYDAGSVANIDWAAMYDEVERSPSFLQKRTARGLKFFIGISDKILRGDYRDDNNLTTAEEIYARSGRQQKKAFRHIQRKNDVLRDDPWKEQAN